jgi:hypothetical protein
MKKKITLQTEFDNNDINHWTYKDQIEQTETNGQFSSFKELVKELANESLLILFLQNEFRVSYSDFMFDEILSRMNESK